jgi:anti-anti-sigma factor
MSDARPAAVTVLVRGDMDAATGDDLRSVLVDVIMHRRPARFVIDLEGVTAVDSATIGLLHAARTTAEDVEVALEFRTAGSPVRGVLDRDGIRDDTPARSGQITA